MKYSFILLIFCFLVLAVIQFSSCKSDISSPGSGQDSINYCGKIYHTVKVGSQTWLKENLDVGTMIMVNKNQVNNAIMEKYCYNNDSANCAVYGGLYQWNEAMAYANAPGSKGICPDGFHIPAKAEFETLAAAVSNNSNSIKAVGQGSAAGAGTNSSGFSALLAGNRYDDGYFYDLGYAANFWSSTENGNDNAYRMFLFVSYTTINLNSHINKKIGFSIRCIKD